MKFAASRASQFAFVLLTAAALATGSLAGCAGGTPFPTAAAVVKNCVVAIAPASTETIGVNLTNPVQAACTDPTYLAVKGYFGGSTVAGSEVISLTASANDVVQFANLDIQPHTATDLGAWTGAYPMVTPNPNKTASPANTDISSAKFTTGPINPGSMSLGYTANVPGVYVLGCAFHYISDNMRTVIIVN
ncbi:MAG TPA: hypothetical protein VEV38_05970 [Candidatus Eremiobacteraceae bacterium]|nr:hypothetical protein [Candidatus Eremiobacteraceae bacterium]